jgi:ABC-type uncharacterized transport system substrate-binding protein
MAAYFDRVLKGTKPPDTIRGQSSTFGLRINLKTRKAFGLTIPAVGATAGGSVKLIE